MPGAPVSNQGSDMSNFVVLLSLLLSEATGVFALTGPPWYEAGKPEFHEPKYRKERIRRVRWSEIAASTIVIGTGAAISWQMKSKIAFLTALAVCAVFVSGYEFMIAHPPNPPGGNRYGGTWGNS